MSAPITPHQKQTTNINWPIKSSKQLRLNAATTCEVVWHTKGMLPCIFACAMCMSGTTLWKLHPCPHNVQCANHIQSFPSKCRFKIIWKHKLPKFPKACKRESTFTWEETASVGWTVWSWATVFFPFSISTLLLPSNHAARIQNNDLCNLHLQVLSRCLAQFMNLESSLLPHMLIQMEVFCRMSTMRKSSLVLLYWLRAILQFIGLVCARVGWKSGPHICNARCNSARVPTTACKHVWGNWLGLYIRSVPIIHCLMCQSVKLGCRWI